MTRARHRPGKVPPPAPRRPAGDNTGMSTPSPSRQPAHPIEPAFHARWSPRGYTDEALPHAVLLQCLEAARWAPSGSNSQPWRFVWAHRGSPAFDAMLAALVPFNQAWARHAAALVTVASAARAVPPGGQEAKDQPSHAFDAGAAWMQFALQAHHLGWATHAMGGFDRERLRQAVQAGPDLALHAVVAIGRAGDPSRLGEDLRAREHPNQRQPLAQFAFEGSFTAAA